MGEARCAPEDRRGSFVFAMEGRDREPRHARQEASCRPGRGSSPPSESGHEQEVSLASPGPFEATRHLLALGCLTELSERLLEAE
jgi:hypothetical protein